MRHADLSEVIGYCLAILFFCYLAKLTWGLVFTREGRREMRAARALQLIGFMLSAAGMLVFLASLIVFPIWEIRLFGWFVGLWGFAVAVLGVVINGLTEDAARREKPKA